MRSKAVIVRASLPLVLVVMIPLGTVIAARQPKPAAALSGSDLFFPWARFSRFAPPI